MKDFQKLSRTEMKNVKGGGNPPACKTGTCNQGRGFCNAAGTICVCCTGAQNCPENEAECSQA
jgi:hypothetical protein